MTKRPLTKEQGDALVAVVAGCTTTREVAERVGRRVTGVNQTLGILYVKGYLARKLELGDKGQEARWWPTGKYRELLLQ